MPDPHPTPRPGLKAALEYGPLLAFFLTYWLGRGGSLTFAGREWSGFMLATLVFVPLSIAATLALWRLTGRLSVMQVLTLVVVVVFGGLSLWLDDPRFLKMKPTIIYLVFAGLLALGLALRRNWLGLALGEALPLTDEGFRLLTGRMVALFLGLALLNEVVWRNFSEATWVSFKTFGLSLILLAFFVAQGGLLKRHARPEPGPDRP